MKRYASRTSTEGDYGNTPQAAALRLQLAGLATLEETETFQEMCAAADARNRAESTLPRWANGQVAEPTEEQAAYRGRGRTHGLIATYHSGCRCDGCRKASADHRRQQRARASA